ncbi:MAG: hypothetical protein C3F11_04825 [Methylocystaceae bacterium]|nr:MAG: hypothetical protein C3F11_04825 [Methylocystaceae bacterium]
MISNFADHAANERTFLAWVRTGVAVIALGFVIEKFNLFVLALGSSIVLESSHRQQMELHLERVSGPLGRYGGSVLVFVGLALIAVATARFVRIERLLDAPELYAARTGRVELALLAALALLVAVFSAYLTLG